MADVEQMWTCRTCRVPLGRVADTSRPEEALLYFHRGGIDVGHEPDPVAGVPVLDRIPVCDFCSQPDPDWAYNTTPAAGQRVTHNMPDGTTQSYRVYSDSWWAACTACANLIDERDFDGLANRAYQRLSRSNPVMRTLSKATVQQGLQQTQRVFTESPLGPRSLITQMTDDA